MANPQKENGYTSISNELFEAILRSDFTQRELKIVFSVIRFTYGFQRKKAELSLRFISNATGIHFQNVKSGLDSLIKRKVLSLQNCTSHKQKRLIQLNKNYELWDLNRNQNNDGLNNNRNQNNDSTVIKTMTETVIKTITKKERKRKHKESDSYFLSLIPESLNYENFINTWKDWINYRNEIKKKVTESTAKLQFKKLEEFRTADIDPVKVIHQSIENGWTGLFELKNYNGNGKVKPEEFQNNLSLNLIEF